MAKKEQTEAEKLLEALKFIEPATGKLDPYQSFIRLRGNYAVAFNGQLSAGYPIDQELTLCPKLDKLKIALARCGKSLVISETPGGQLSVKGDKLRALIPCFSAEDLPPALPDQPVGNVTDVLKEAFKVCGVLASETGDKVHLASLLIGKNFCTSTNGNTMLQFWHGIDLPENIILPKVFTEAVIKIPLAVEKIGVVWLDGKPSHVTFWFENGAWLKTACYRDSWPKIAHIIEQPNQPEKTPVDLFEGIEAVSHFNDGGVVFLSEGFVKSNDGTDTIAEYNVAGLNSTLSFTASLIKQVAPFVEYIDLATYTDKAFFYGGKEENPIRGVIMARGFR